MNNQIRTKKDMATAGAAMIFAGGILTLFIITAIIGIPIMILGALTLIAAPFYKPKHCPECGQPTQAGNCWNCSRKKMNEKITGKKQGV